MRMQTHRVSPIASDVLPVKQDVRAGQKSIVIGGELILKLKVLEKVVVINQRDQIVISERIKLCFFAEQMPDKAVLAK